MQEGEEGSRKEVEKEIVQEERKRRPGKFAQATVKEVKSLQLHLDDSLCLQIKVAPTTLSLQLVASNSQSR